MLVAGVLLTPIARRLVVWWPGGGAVYVRPVAIEYLDGSRTRQKHIVPIQSLAFGALATLGMAAITTSFALRRKEKVARYRRITAYSAKMERRATR